MLASLLKTILYNRNSYCIILLAFVTVYGDFIVNHTNLHLFRAVFDNATHAAVGALSWFIVCLNCQNHTHPLLEIGLCGFIASVIDIDHFIAAKSFSLKDATQLQTRPLFHCSTVPIVVVLLLLSLSHWFFDSDSGKRFALIFLTAFASHHVRDATRRGFWFWPFGSTSRIPYFSYVTLTCVIPYVICWLSTCFEARVYFLYKKSPSVI